MLAAATQRGEQLRRDQQRRRRGSDGSTTPAAVTDDSGSGAVNGVEQLRGDASSDRSILDERCDFDELDDVVDSNEVGRPWSRVSGAHIEA
ncbi:hypothetical protein Scep_019395 [Stephania cephalantha]|uniref:Uncharacterized protein n=1 Tax=Stephania cephalantha TaxID=152367 RepID=A0AAP0IAL0_9MAGN